ADRFLLFALRQMRRALARVINHPLRIGIRLGHNFLITLLRFREFFANLLGIELSLFNLSPAIFENSENRLVGKAAQQERNDAKADHLREKELPIPAESFGRIAKHLAKTLGSSRSGDDDIHKMKLAR